MPNIFRSPLAYTAAISGAVILLVFALSTGRSVSSSSRTPGKRQPVIIELFTSEGCSSCPPADELLKRLSEQESVDGVQVIALEEHVDYWNNLGWKDPFSMRSFSERQNSYARIFGRDGVYTPQMIVDGHTEFVGSRGTTAREALMQAATTSKANVILTPDTAASGPNLSFTAQVADFNRENHKEDADLGIAVTERGLQTDVKAGENSGETLVHAAVVRTLRRLGTVTRSTPYKNQVSLAISSDWKKENLLIVGFLSEQDSRRIVGIGTAAVPNVSR